MAAEEKAAASAKEGLGRRVKEAEATAQALAENVEELRLTLDRQRASAELRYSPQHYSGFRFRAQLSFPHKEYAGNDETPLLFSILFVRCEGDAADASGPLSADTGDLQSGM